MAPRKIILSRKGFDSAAGGNASPILPDGELLSLPIPHSKDDNRYSDVLSQNGTPLKHYMDQLGIKPYSKNPDYDGERCHLDPDLRCSSKSDRGEDWVPAFGSGTGPTTHLQKHGVGPGDLFLFFGRYYPTVDNGDGLRWARGSKLDSHVIFGYLEIAERYLLAEETTLPKNIAYHPHAKYLKDKTHAIFTAPERLGLNSSLPGAGVFKYNELLKLTKNGHSRTRWNLDKDIFGGTSISYHPDPWKEKNGDSYFQSAYPGQEFVIDVDGNERIIGWLETIFAHSEINT